jgi:hypothetical protein
VVHFTLIIERPYVVAGSQAVAEDLDLLTSREVSPGFRGCIWAGILFGSFLKDSRLLYFKFLLLPFLQGIPIRPQLLTEHNATLIGIGRTNWNISVIITATKPLGEELHDELTGELGQQFPLWRVGESFQVLRKMGGKELSQLVVKGFLVVDLKELGLLLWFGVTKEQRNPVQSKGHGGLSSNRLHRS